MTLAHVTTVKELQGLSVEAMLRAQSELFTKGYGSATFGMVEDGRTFDRTPIEAIAADPSLSKPLLIGTNSEEMRYWTALDASPIDEQPESVLQARLSRIFGPDARNLLSVYTSDGNSYSEAVIQLLGDVVFRLPSIRLAELNSDRRPTYVYLFTYRSLTKGPTGLEYGSMHGLELAFVFHVDSSMGYSYVGPKGSWAHLSDQMVDAWTRFARTGDPNGAGLPTWPRYGAEQHATMEFGIRTDVALDPYGAERRAWQKIPSQKFDQAEAVRFADPPAEKAKILRRKVVGALAICVNTVGRRVAMHSRTVEVECEQGDNCEDTHRNENSRAGGMCVRRRAHRNRFSGALGLARSFRRESARAWRCLRDLRGQLAKSLPGNQRNDEDHELQGCSCGTGAVSALDVLRSFTSERVRHTW